MKTLALHNREQQATEVQMKAESYSKYLPFLFLKRVGSNGDSDLVKLVTAAWQPEVASPFFIQSQ